MPQTAGGALFNKEEDPSASHTGSTSAVPIYTGAGDSGPAYPLHSRVSRSSTTHDMSTGTARAGAGRGYAFDEAPQAPLSIARYTSRTSEHSETRTRPRRGSIRVGGLELNRESCSPGGEGSGGCDG